MSPSPQDRRRLCSFAKTNRYAAPPTDLRIRLWRGGGQDRQAWRNLANRRSEAGSQGYRLAGLQVAPEHGLARRGGYDHAPDEPDGTGNSAREQPTSPVCSCSSR